MMASRIRAGDGPSPLPRNNGGFTTTLIFGYFYLRIEMPDLFEREGAEHGAVVLDVSGKTSASRPITLDLLLARLRIHRRHTRELRRNLDLSFVD